jgi:hypothetical protein
MMATAIQSALYSERRGALIGKQVPQRCAHAWRHCHSSYDVRCVGKRKSLFLGSCRCGKLRPCAFERPLKKKESPILMKAHACCCCVIAATALGGADAFLAPTSGALVSSSRASFLGASLSPPKACGCPACRGAHAASCGCSLCRGSHHSASCGCSACRGQHGSGCSCRACATSLHMLATPTTEVGAALEGLVAKLQGTSAGHKFEDTMQVIADSYDYTPKP